MYTRTQEKGYLRKSSLVSGCQLRKVMENLEKKQKNVRDNFKYVYQTLRLANTIDK